MKILHLRWAGHENEAIKIIMRSKSEERRDVRRPKNGLIVEVMQDVKYLKISNGG